ncbi:hypothetical protein VKI21_15270 [Cyanobacterium aponinum UTEX 3222]|nr:hypothetical protein VKI21_15270 [Cyanobacterium aponinum UTEX 3222]
MFCTYTSSDRIFYFRNTINDQENLYGKKLQKLIVYDSKMS